MKSETIIYLYLGALAFFGITLAIYFKWEVISQMIHSRGLIRFYVKRIYRKTNRVTKRVLYKYSKINRAVIRPIKRNIKLVFRVICLFFNKLCNTAELEGELSVEYEMIIREQVEEEQAEDLREQELEKKMRERQLRKRSRAGIRCMRTSERYKDNSYEYGEENDEEDYYDSEEEDLEIDEGYLSMTTTSVTESEEEGDEYEGELNRSGSENGMVNGLINTGNTCFLNSVLQALASSQYLKKYLKQKIKQVEKIKRTCRILTKQKNNLNGYGKDKRDRNYFSNSNSRNQKERLRNRDNNNNRGLGDGFGFGFDIEDLDLGFDFDMEVTYGLYETLKFINTMAIEPSAIKPYRLLHAISKKVQISEQQDAQEAFQLLSAALTEECVRMEQVLNSIKKSMTGVLGMSLFDEEEGGEYNNTRKAERIEKQEGIKPPFFGLLASRLSCVNCGYTEAIRHFGFDNISLSLPPIPVSLPLSIPVPAPKGSEEILNANSDTQQNVVELIDVLREYVELEELEGEIECKKCTVNYIIKNKVEELTKLASINNSGISKREKGKRVEFLKGQINMLAKSIRTNTLWTFFLQDSEELDSSDEEEEEERENGDCSEDNDCNDGSRDEYKSDDIYSIDNIRRKVAEDVRRIKVYSSLKTKQTMLANLPKTLILHLQRSTISMSTGYIVKNSVQVKYPEYLVLDEFVTSGYLGTNPNQSMSSSNLHEMNVRGANNDEMNGKKYIYQLQAVIVHFGCHSYGHFITYRRKPSINSHSHSYSQLQSYYYQEQNQTQHQKQNQTRNLNNVNNDGWYLVSDEEVLSVDVEEALGANPYLLFYERI